MSEEIEILVEQDGGTTTPCGLTSRCSYVGVGLPIKLPLESLEKGAESRGLPSLPRAAPATANQETSVRITPRPRREPLKSLRVGEVERSSLLRGRISEAIGRFTEIISYVSQRRAA